MAKSSTTPEFKEQCVNAALSDLCSVNEIVAKYNISNDSVLRKWIMQYNANMELKDYDLKREVYMAEAKCRTTLSERMESTKYCIEHNKDYKGTAVLYNVSYSQVYSWMKQGEDGLTDKRDYRM